MTPLVSIVLPTRNGERYLAQAIAAIKAQDCSDWELIVVDDGSTDNTANIIAAAVADDVRISGRRNPGGKLPGALNYGFAHARGTLLTWTSDDNLLAPDAIRQLTGALVHDPHVDIAYAGYHRVDANDQLIDHQPAGPPERLLSGNPIGACFLYRRKVHDHLGGYDEHLFGAEDYDFWLRAATRFRFMALSSAPYRYRLHAASLTATRGRMIALTTMIALARTLPKLPWQAPEQRSEALCTLAAHAYRAGDDTRCRHWLAKALRTAPRTAFTVASPGMLTLLLTGWRPRRTSAG